MRDKQIYRHKQGQTILEIISTLLYGVIFYAMLVAVVICVLSSLLNTSYIADIFSHGYFQTDNTLRYYSANVGSFFDWMKSWGWIFYGYIPFPMIPLTTTFSILFVIRGVVVFIIYYILIVLTRMTRSRVLELLSLILIPIVIFGAIDTERRALDDFQTKQELVSFLSSDHIDDMLYGGGFNCEDFSRELIQNAKKQGYLIYYHTIPNHAMCEAYVISENRWYLIEPQTDRIERSKGIEKKNWN